MKTILRLLAVLIFFGALGWWVQAGQNKGWTKNQVAIEKTDEFTGIIFKEYQKQFVPGVDLVAGAGAAALVLLGLSFVRGRKAVR